MSVTSTAKPVLALVANATKRRAVLDAAVEAEQRGFPGIAVPSLGAGLAFCASLAQATHDLTFCTAIQPIYLASANEVAMTAAYLHEVSGGRFTLGLGVSHEAMNKRVLGAQPGRPLADVRSFVEGMRGQERFAGALPPVHLATLRDRMLGLAIEIAQGAIWANASRSHAAVQLDRVPGARTPGFGLSNMIPCVIDDDREAAAAVNRKTMSVYVRLPNYRNYWSAAGYEEEMAAIEAAIDAGEHDRVPLLMSDRWLSDCTLYGSAEDVREGLEAWRDLGVTPIAVMSSTSGGQLKAVQELFDAYA